MRTLLILLAFLAVAHSAAADPCQGNNPTCTVDHSTGAFVAFPTGAVNCTVTDGGAFSTTVSGTGKVAFTVPTATAPGNLVRQVTAFCTDAFGQKGASTVYTGTFPKPAAPAAPVVSGN